MFDRCCISERESSVHTAAQSTTPHSSLTLTLHSALITYQNIVLSHTPWLRPVIFTRFCLKLVQLKLFILPTSRRSLGYSAFILRTLPQLSILLFQLFFSEWMINKWKGLIVYNYNNKAGCLVERNNCRYNPFLYSSWYSKLYLFITATREEYI